MIVTLAMFGCSTFGPWDDATAPDTGEPTERVVVSPGVIDFGTISVNSDGYAVGALTLFNLGSTGVSVTGHDEPIGGSAFRIESPPVVQLEPGAELDLEVRYTPTTDQVDAARLLIDPGGEVIELHGRATAPVVVAATPSLDPVVLGCTGHGAVRLQNIGTEDLDVSEATMEGSDFSITSFPVHIYAGGEAQVAVSFTPGGGGPRGGTLLLTSNDPLHPTLGVAVSALGYEGERVTESFRYTPSNPTDLLFVVGVGAETEITERASEVLPLFVEALREANIDYQLTALSANAPCPAASPGWAERSDTSLQAQAVLEQGFSQAGGPWEDDLLGLAREALARTGDAGCLDGFRRSDADLHILVVADGPPGFDPDLQAADLAADVSLPASLRVSVLVPLSDACGSPAPAYVDLAARYNGSAGDLCAEDWTAAFLEFAALPETQTAVHYTLAEVPVVTTMEVRAEGLSFAEWWFDSVANDVVFDGAQAPVLGAEITIEYVSAVACE